MGLPGVTELYDLKSENIMNDVGGGGISVDPYLLEVEYSSTMGLIHDLMDLLSFCGTVMAVWAPLHP
jgi:hypothetical protein